MWRHTSRNDYPHIILHDCMIEQGRIENNSLVLVFDDSGFWINKDHPENPHGQILRTDRSEICFTGCDADSISISVFSEVRALSRWQWTRRKQISLEDFLARLGSGGWRFEFVGEYYAIGSAFFCGDLHSDHKPYHIECQIEVRYTDMVYSWNQVYEDRTW